MSETITGRVEFFDPARGYGFIVRDDHSDDVFAHASQVSQDCDLPRAGDRVSFILDKDRHGRPAARDIVILNGEAA